MSAHRNPNYHITHLCTMFQAEIEGRSQGMHAIKALKAVVPGFEKAKLRCTHYSYVVAR